MINLGRHLPPSESRGSLGATPGASLSRPAEEISPMTSRLARSAMRNLLALWLASAAAHAGDSVFDRITIEPTGTVLDGRRAWAQLIVTGHHGDGSVRDLTHASEWSSSDPTILVVRPG